MSAQNVLDGLDALKSHPALTDYIKREHDSRSLTGYGGYNNQETLYQEQLSDLLDSNHMHSGASYSFVLMNIQAVLLGRVTREEFEAEAIRDKEWYAANR